MSHHRDAVERYARHARLYGTEQVFETAMTELTDVQLGGLSLRLQAMKPSWRPDGDRVAFAERLIGAGLSSEQACRRAMISRSTLRRAQVPGQTPDLVENGSDHPQPRGANGANRGTPTKAPSGPDLTISGAEDGSQPFVGQQDLFAEVALA